MYPFAMLRLNPVIWSFWGMSKYASLIPLNKAINEIGAGTMDMIKRALQSANAGQGKRYRQGRL